MGDNSQSTPNRHTWNPDQAIHLPRPSYSKDVSDSGLLSKTKPAVKRLFSESHDGLDRIEGTENDYDPKQEDGVLNSLRKRHRNSDWPLPNATQDAPSRAPLRSRPSAPNSPKYPHRTSSAQQHQKSVRHKTSSFIEGSMRDRPSQPPPAIYTDYEARTNRSAAEQEVSAIGFTRTDSGNFAPPADGSSTLPPTKAEPQKPSPMYRFGINVFAAFNPSTWKQRFSKSSKDPRAQKKSNVGVGIGAGMTSDISASNEAYQQLKASSNFKAHMTQSSRFPRPQSTAQASSGPAQKHDPSAEVLPSQSSISLPHYPRQETPKKDKRYGRPYAGSVPGDEGEYYEEVDSRAPSPSSIAKSVPVSKKRNSFSFTRPNLRRNSASVSASVVSLTGCHTVRRMPSKKNLAESQKLVSKISNLEFQLSEAKRKLEALKGEPSPPPTMESLEKTLRERPAVDFSDEPPRVGRRRFVPGALATLPSERFLNAHTEPEDEEGNDNDNSDEAVSQSAADDEFTPVTHAEWIARSIGNHQQSHEQSLVGDRKLRDIKRTQPNLIGSSSVEVAVLHAGNDESDSNSSSIHEPEVTGDTVIHYHESPQHVVGEHVVGDILHKEIAVKHGLNYSSDDEQNVLHGEVAVGVNSAYASDSEGEGDLAKIQETQVTSNAETVKRNVSAKRKSFGALNDDGTYRPPKSESDDDALWDEAAKDSTPRKRGSRPSLKKQKTSATDNRTAVVPGKIRAGKKPSVDSPKGSFVSSTKYPNRASAIISTPPKAPFTDSPLSKSALAPSPRAEPKPKSPRDSPQPPLFPFTFTSGDHHVRPGTPAKKPLQKRPASPALAAKKSVPVSNDRNGLAKNSQTQNSITSRRADAIPPVPEISKEMLKKQQELRKQKKLTLEDIRRHQKASSIASSAHPHQDVARQSTEEGTSMSAKTNGIRKGQMHSKETNADFKWDEDVF